MSPHPCHPSGPSPRPARRFCRLQAPVLVALFFVACTGFDPPSDLGTHSESPTQPESEVERVPGRRAEVTGDQVALLTDDGELFLEARPARSEGLLRFAARFTGSPQNAPDVAAANAGTQRLEAAYWYRVPFELLLAQYQLAVLQALFPQDRGLAEGWEHLVLAPPPAGSETLWRLAEWLSGDGRDYRVIRAHNELIDEQIHAGQRIVVPAAILRPALRAALPPSSEEPLQYRAVGDEGHAIYHLKSGEALYSAVVVRFTGRVFAEDVNQLAAELARLSDIADVTDIPAGYPIRIPFEHLMPEFLPADHPERREYARSLAAARQHTNRARAERLDGITVILDAGHGGRDVGAVAGDVWESVHTYDVMLRTKELLETLTAATVYTTTRDGDSSRIPSVDVLPHSRSHAVLTSPPYPIEDSTVGVNLRWYLANSILHRLVSSGGDPDRVIFISIHADSLHPSLRGGMAYVPGASGRRSSFSRSGTVYASRSEVRERPEVRFSTQDAVRSEGLSRELAQKILQGFERTGLELHPYRPVRDRIVQSPSRQYVPAVLRYNEVPASVLVEICNLNNVEDRRLIQTQRFRQQVAEALVHGILDYYGFPVSPEILAAGSVTALRR